MVAFIATFVLFVGKSVLYEWGQSDAIENKQIVFYTAENWE